MIQYIFRDSNSYFSVYCIFDCLVIEYQRKGVLIVRGKKKAIIAVCTGVAVIGAAVAAAHFMPFIKMHINAEKYAPEPVNLTVKADRIYFLNTGSADAILIESDGKFALVDGAEDSDNPRGFEELAYEGTEEYVVETVKKIAGDENGKVVLEFVLGTHSHSDHIGGLDTLILDEDITVRTVYIKEYDESIINSYETEKWDNREVYEQLISACEKRNVPVVHDISEEKFTFGNFTLKFCNTADTGSSEPVGENENAIGLLVEKDGLKAFLAADINNLDGDEDRLASELGKVDLLKVGHHGYDESTGVAFVKALSPEIAVVTNRKGGASRTPVKNLNSVNAAIFETGRYNGIVAQFDGGKIILYKDLDSAVGVR